MSSKSYGMAMGVALLAAMGSVSAGNAPQLTEATFAEIDDMLPAVKDKPNEAYRLHGLKAYSQGNYANASERFERAAFYADKYSQHYLSLMNWYGTGIPEDHVAAYVWSDLAAERGIPSLLRIREKMWSQLTEAQREQAMERGVEAYGRYGDDVAMPRAESEIRRLASSMTGSRVGWRGQKLVIQAAPPSGSFTGPGSKDALAQFASADELYGRESGARLGDYWEQQDRLLSGTVTLGSPETAGDKTP